MARRATAAEVLDARTAEVMLILGDLTEHLGAALVAWSEACEAARAGDYDTALAKVLDVQVACDVPLRVGRSEIRSITGRVASRLEAELPAVDG